MDRCFILVLLLSAGCFPYRETYRPNIEGVVRDAEGAPQANLRIESCSATHWNSRCRYHGNTTTDQAGRFRFSEKKEWDWCCLGEAPLPYTMLAACGEGGRVATTRVNGPPEKPIELVLRKEPLRDEWAAHACAN